MVPIISLFFIIGTYMINTLSPVTLLTSISETTTCFVLIAFSKLGLSFIELTFSLYVLETFPLYLLYQS